MGNASYVRYKDKEKRKRYLREYMRRYMKKYGKKYRERCKREGRDYWGQKSSRLRAQVIEILGGPVCNECGCTAFHILEINHKNGGGRKALWDNANERIKSFRGIIKGSIDKKDFNILCRVCNALHYVREILGIDGHSVKWSMPASSNRKTPVS